MIKYQQYYQKSLKISFFSLINFTIKLETILEDIYNFFDFNFYNNKIMNHTDKFLRTQTELNCSQSNVNTEKRPLNNKTLEKSNSISIIKITKNHQKIRIGKCLEKFYKKYNQNPVGNLRKNWQKENQKRKNKWRQQKIEGNNQQIANQLNMQTEIKDQQLKQSEQRRNQQALNQSIKKRDEQQKEDKTLALENAFAYGHLIGVNDLGVSVRTFGLFQGIFDGAFQYDQNIIYFEGKIESISHQIVLESKIQKNQKRDNFCKSLFCQKKCIEQLGLTDITFFKGVFKGQFKQVGNSRIYRQRQHSQYSQQTVEFSFVKNQYNVEFKGLSKAQMQKFIKDRIEGDNLRVQNIIDQTNKSQLSPKKGQSYSPKKGQCSSPSKEDQFQQFKSRKFFFDQSQTSEQQKPIKKKTSTKSKLKKQAEKFSKKQCIFMVPTLLTFDLGTITEINLQKSHVKLSGTINIDIRLNKEVIQVLENNKRLEYIKRLSEQQAKKFDKKSKSQKEEIIEKYKFQYYLTVDFHRGKLFNLPFYIVYQEQESQIEDEWADIWDGIDKIPYWDQTNHIMSYKITTVFTGEINNSHGIFYSPFNLNIVRLLIDFHAIKIGSIRIDFNCCDLSDSSNSGSYQPYTLFSDLQINQYGKTQSEKYRKHFDRLTKINTTSFVNPGYYKLADNRMTLFPYYKRVLANSAFQAQDCKWTCACRQKQQLVAPPQVRDIKKSYQKILNEPKKKYEIFQFPVWEFVHIEIPIFKYPVIDMISIFFAITILSTIGLLIFGQENAVDQKEFTTLSKRIASGCSLLIAYLALIPFIRSNLPPTPSITLIQILVYASTIPNFLAIIANISSGYKNYQDFFQRYFPFRDALFLISFVVSITSFVIIVTIAIASICRKDESKFKFKKFEPATIKSIQSPMFLQFLQDMKEYRAKQYNIEEFQLPQIKNE